MSLCCKSEVLGLWFHMIFRGSSNLCSPSWYQYFGTFENVLLNYLPSHDTIPSQIEYLPTYLLLSTSISNMYRVGEYTKELTTVEKFLGNTENKNVNNILDCQFQETFGGSAEPRFVLYQYSNCPFCSKVRAYLHSCGEEFQIVEVRVDVTVAAFATFACFAFLSSA